MTPRKLYLSLSDRAEVHNHYMPMISGGGLFVPSNDDFIFDEKVVLQVDLISEKQKAAVFGRVVWITPTGAPRGLMKGIGLQFQGANQVRVQRYFESIIGESLFKAPQFPSY